MTDKKASQEDAAANVADADLWAGVKGGLDVKFTFAQVKTWIKGWIVKGDVGLGSVDNTSDAGKPVSTAQQTALDLKANQTSVDLKANLASPTFTGAPAAPTAAPGTNTTQLATTAFAVAEILARVASLDAAVYKGVIDCSANPNYPAADAGWTYRVSVAGKIGGASGPNVEVGDMMMCITDGTASGTQAAVGANWDIIQTNIDGAVVGPASSTDNAAARYDLATGKLLQNSALLIADTTGALSRTGGGGIQHQGTNTNDSAASGEVGEIVTATVAIGSAVALTTATPANVTSISLTAGDWDVFGAIGFIPGATTNVTQFIASASTTTGALDTTPGRFFSFNLAPYVPGAAQQNYAVPVSRFSLSGTTTVFLVAQSAFTVSTMGGFGNIRARRVR